MLGYKRPKPREAEHLAFRVVGFYEAVAVEERAASPGLQGVYLLLLIVHTRHEAQEASPLALSSSTSPLRM